MTTMPYPLTSTMIGFALAPMVALTIAFTVHRDLADTIGSTTVYFLVSYTVSFPLFRLIRYHGMLASLVALAYALPIAWFGFWWGGLGIGTALALAVALPHGRDAERISHP